MIKIVKTIFFKYTPTIIFQEASFDYHHIGEGQSGSRGIKKYKFHINIFIPSTINMTPVRHGTQVKFLLQTTV